MSKKVSNIIILAKPKQKSKYTLYDNDTGYAIREDGWVPFGCFSIRKGLLGWTIHFVLSNMTYYLTSEMLEEYLDIQLDSPDRIIIRKMCTVPESTYRELVACVARPLSNISMEEA